MKSYNKSAPDQIKHRKRLKKKAVNTTLFALGISLIVGLMMGAQFYEHYGITKMFTPLPEPENGETGYTIFNAILDMSDKITNDKPSLSWIYPFYYAYPLIALLVTFLIGLLQLDKYEKNKNTMVGKEEGTGDFNDDPMAFARQYSYPPKQFSGSLFRKIIYFPKRIVGKTLLTILRFFHKPPVEEDIEVDPYANDELEED